MPQVGFPGFGVDLLVMRFKLFIPIFLIIRVGITPSRQISASKPTNFRGNGTGRQCLWYQGTYYNATPLWTPSHKLMTSSSLDEPKATWVHQKRSLLIPWFSSYFRLGDHLEPICFV